MKKHLIRLSVFVAILCSTNLAALEIGDQVPSFKATNDQGKPWNSESFLGKKFLLVYFYPAAMTGGCTKQACSFRDDNAKWKEMDVEVVGISGDHPENLSLFKEAENLNFTLLADPKGKVAKTFGVPVGKGGTIDRFVKSEKFTLKRGVTTKRWTFLLSKAGKVLYANEKVQAALDSSLVLDFLKKTRKP
jgi:peroxiredoxin Q/BCP